MEPVRDTVSIDTKFLQPIPTQLAKRKLTEKTLRHWGYGVAEYHGKKVQVANYYNKDNHVVAQKVRHPNKDFTVIGSLKDAGLYVNTYAVMVVR